MTNLLLLLLVQVTAVASFAPKFQHYHSCHYAAQHPTHKDHHTQKSIFSNASELQYSLTADDWHTAAQLHPLNNLGVGDDEFMMMSDGSSNGAVIGVGNRGGAAMSASHHATAGATAVIGDDDMVKEIMEAFLPVLLLISMRSNFPVCGLEGQNFPPAPREVWAEILEPFLA